MNLSVLLLSKYLMSKMSLYSLFLMASLMGSSFMLLVTECPSGKVIEDVRVAYHFRVKILPCRCSAIGPNQKCENNRVLR